MFKRYFLKSFALFALLLSAQFASADVSGNWVFAVTIMDQTGNPQVTMMQDGAVLAGHYNGQLGNSDFKGTVNGDDFQFVLASEAGSVTYKGTLQADGTIKGNLDAAGMAQGTFTGKKAD